MGKSLNDIKYFLVDNGSLNPEATLNLRRIAKALSGKTGLPIRPVGLMHSHKVDAQKLDGVAAETMESLLQSEECREWKHVVMIPLFFGPSLAITDWLPRKLKQWQAEDSTRSFRILPCLHFLGDDRIARALTERTLDSISAHHYKKPFVALVDHGTPLPEVNQIREDIGQQIKALLSAEISGFSTCSMERREGSEYNFNDPLLEDKLRELAAEKVEQVVVAQLFLSPGRHAGKGGDLEEICSFFPGSVARTELLGMHPLILEILAERLTPLSKE